MTLYERLTTEDWLTRGNNSFVTRAHSRSRIGWDTGIKKGDAFSTFLFKAPKYLPDAQKYLTARRLSLGIINSMNLTKKPINFQLNTKNLNCTDGQKIMVSSEPISDKSACKSFNHGLDVILGLTAHEMCHVLYTDDDYFNHLKEQKETLEKAGKLWRFGMLKNIMNVVEDERIEGKMGIPFPGFSNYIGQTKDYMFAEKCKETWGEMEADWKKEKTAEDMQELSALGLTFVHFLRYPKILKEKWVIRFEKQLGEFESILTPYPENTKEVIEASEKIVDIFEKFIEDEVSQESKDKFQQEAEKQKKLGLGKGGEEGMMEELLKALMKAIEEGDIEQGDGEDVEGIDVAVMDLSNRVKAEDLENRKDQSADKIIYKDADGMLSTTIQTVVKHAKTPDVHRYEKSLNRVKVSASKFRAKLKKFNRNLFEDYCGLYEGTFDEDRIIDARIGAKDVYKQRAKIKNNGAAIGLLVDESGSMGGTEIENARDIAVLYERALSGLNGIDFYCYGHTTTKGIGESSYYYGDEATLLNVYFEGRKGGNRLCLGNLSAQNTNRDGHAILQAAGRIRQHTNQPVILFVLSDGMPSANVPSGYNRISYTKKCAEEIERNNFKIIHIAITPEVKSEEMFKRYVKFTDMNTFVNDMTSLLDKTIRTIQTPEIEYE